MKFPKILQNLFEGHTLPNIFRKLPKIAENLRGRPKIFRSYTNEFKYNLRYKLDISESIDILTSEDMENTPLEFRTWFRMNFTSGVFSSKTLLHTYILYCYLPNGKLGGDAEQLIDGSEKRICRLSFEFESPHVIEKRSKCCKCLRAL